MLLSAEGDARGSAQNPDPHLLAPALIRDAFKRYRRASAEEISLDRRIIDLLNEERIGTDKRVTLLGTHATCMRNAVSEGAIPSDRMTLNLKELEDKPVYGIKGIPGLQILPTFLPPSLQIQLLDWLLHRDLSCPTHQTNVHFHHQIEYPSDAGSFFGQKPGSAVLIPKDETTHRTATVQQFLDRKLRWLTLGGQYDWTRKLYPDGIPPPFPQDIERVLHALFPAMKPEAAIVNIYSPGDTLSMHRDVAEACAKPLLSVSFGCDALFIIGCCNSGAEPEDLDFNEESVTVRLRSGDVVVMAGASRYAFHGVPKIFGGTCPSYLQSWPVDTSSEAATDSAYAPFADWMTNKRVNLNVRQMCE